MRPVGDGRSKVLALERGAAGEGQRLQVAGLDLQRARDQSGRLARRALGHGGQHIGVVDQQLRIVRRQRHRARIRLDCFGEALQRGIRAAEHEPACRVIGLGLHALSQLLDHRDHVGFGHRRLRGGLRHQAGGVAEPRVQADCGQGHRQAQRHGQQRGAAAARCGLNARAFCIFFEHAAFEFGARGQVLRGVDACSGEIGVEQSLLLAQHREVGGAVAVSLRGAAACAQHRPEHEGTGGEQQGCGAEVEGGHRSEGPAGSGFSKRRARASSASLGAALARRWARWRMARHSAKAASASNANGPTHSNTVLAFSGGR